MKDAIALSLILPDKKYVQYLNEITSTTLFDRSGKEIDKHGLYSQTIFGTVGSERRTKTFAYINLYADILHPRLYLYLTNISTVYTSILNGTAYVKLDKKTGTFTPSTMQEGETGYQFFIDSLPFLKHKRTGSAERNNKIDVINKYVKDNKYLNNKLLVLPAGLREFSVDGDDRVEEDELNDLYRAVLTASILISNFNLDKNVDSFKLNIQNKMHAVYLHIFALLDGKKKFINGQFGSRAVEFRSRTVLSGTPTIIHDLDTVDNDTLDTTEVGILQYCKSIDPIAKHHILNMFSKNVFREDSLMANLIDPDDYSAVSVEVPRKVQDSWMTYDGLDSILNSAFNSDVKNEAVMIGKYIFGLVLDTGDNITYYENVELIPEDKLKQCRPITLGEVLLLSVHETIGKFHGFVTRYPITEQGSIFPTLIKVHSTSEVRDVTFTVVGELSTTTAKIKGFSIPDKYWINSISVPTPRLEGLSADFDGDSNTLSVIMSEEANKEVADLLASTAAYVGPDGRSMLSLGDNVTENVVKFLTK